MNIFDYFLKKKKDNSILVSQLSKLGISELDADEMQRLIKGIKTQNLIPLSINIGGKTIKTEALLSINRNPDGSDSLLVHSVVSDQLRLKQIADSENGIDTVFAMFNGDEDRINSFLRRNNLLDEFKPASSLYWELVMGEKHFINSYLDVDVDKGEAVIQAKKDYVDKANKLDEFSNLFKATAASFNRINGAELEPEQLRELKQGKTIEVNNLIDDKGEKYSGFITLNLTKEQIKDFKDNPGKAVNVSKRAIVTPKNDYKIQVNQNNHGFRTEENKFSTKAVKTGDIHAQDTKDKKKGIGL